MLGTEWIFDDSPLPDPHGKGERAVQFLRLLKHPKSKSDGKGLDVAPFYERIVRKIYGDTDANGDRIVKTAFILLPRGNRKTAFGAGLALLHTIGPEKRPEGQVVSAAADRDQARVAFDDAWAIVEMEPRLKAVVDVVDSRNWIDHVRTGARYRAISADAKKHHGGTPNFVLADELHAWPKRALWDVLRTGLTKEPGGLMMVITTAGRGQENVAHAIYDYAKKVESGAIDDPSFLPVIFEAPRDCDWRDEAVWHAVNPGLRYGFPDLAGLRTLAREAENRPADREAFRQLHLNIWLDHAVDPFLDMGVYDQGAGEVDLAFLERERCWIGVDMSTTTDLTAVVACWRDDDDGYIVQPYFFVPADNLRTRADRDGVDYVRWAAEGYITATPGNVVDYRAVESCIRGLCERFDVQEIAFDKAYAQPVMAPLEEDGLPVVVLQLGWVTQSPALNEVERAVIAGKFRHGGHPVLRWCFENVAIQTDAAGNRTMHKGKSRERIDGAFATWMAVSRAAAAEDPMSVYAGGKAEILWI